jgi:hypothetical protein
MKEVIMDNLNSQLLVVNRQSKASLSTKLALALSLFALLFFSVFGYAQAEPCTPAGSVNTFGLNCAFYGGDFAPNNPNANGLANETDATVNGNPYGAATFQNFNWGGGQIDGLFTNNLSGLNPSSGYWEVRSGMSEGNGGTLLASGTGTSGGASFLHTATNNTAFGYQEYTDAVKTPGLSLGAGKYWFSVVPNDPNSANRSYNSNTFVSGGAIGTDTNNDQYFDSAFFGTSFTNANTQGVFQDFSSGVLQGSVPEPSSLMMLGSGVLGIGGLLRRRLLG